MPSVYFWRQENEKRTCLHDYTVCSHSGMSHHILVNVAKITKLVFLVILQCCNIGDQELETLHRTKKKTEHVLNL